MMSAPAARYWRWMSPITSGRVRISRSLLPWRSFGWSAKRRPRKSASVSLRRWIIVPIAPSRIRMRPASARSSAFHCGGRRSGDEGRLSGMSGRPLCSRRGFDAAGNQHDEGIAGAAGADGDLDVARAGVAQQPGELVVFETQPLVAEPLADPLLGMLAQVEHQHAATGTHDADGLGEGARRVRGMVERLRQQRNVDARVLERQLLELAALPLDVRQRAA